LLCQRFDRELKKECPLRVTSRHLFRCGQGDL
jgi:hypothetical protein